MADGILSADVSPGGAFEAFVHQDDRSAVLYVRAPETTGRPMRAVWVRNLVAAPTRADEDVTLRDGVSPLMPARHCAHPDGAPPLEADRLRFLWFEEEDAVALLEDGAVLAVVPSWSGLDKVHGYARDAVGRGPWAWSLQEYRGLEARVAAAEAAWAAWEEDPTPWPALQRGQVAAWEAAFGPHRRYFALDGGTWPPKALLWLHWHELTVLGTVGVGVRPQPGVELYTEQPGPLRRVELAVALGPEWSEPRVRDVAAWLGAQTSYPWLHGTWLGAGHTLPCAAFGTAAPFAGVLFREAPAGAPAVHLPPFRGDPVRVLWLVPVTAGELAFARSEGTPALEERLDAAGHGWFAVSRDPVA